MVKIKDLQDSQLVEQIAKYKKIVDELYKERDRRTLLAGSDEGLLTPEEIKLKQEQGGSVAADASMFSVSFDDEEISEMQRNIEEKKDSQGEGEGEVGVTQLLTLSKEQRAALKKNASSPKNKKKKLA